MYNKQLTQQLLFIVVGKIMIKKAYMQQSLSDLDCQPQRQHCCPKGFNSALLRLPVIIAPISYITCAIVVQCYSNMEWNNILSSNYFLSSIHIAYIHFDLLSSSSTWNSEEHPQIIQPEPLHQKKNPSGLVITTQHFKVLPFPHVLTTLLQSVARTWGLRIDGMPTYGALLSLLQSK